jgi:sugar phosphate isomerase/epimerase
MGIKYGICEWSLPLTGPYNCRIVSEVGLDGMSLDAGTYELNYPLSNKRIQDNYLSAKKQWNIEYSSIVINDLCNFSMCADKGTKDRTVAMLAVKKSLDAAHYMGIPVLFLPSFQASDIKDENDFMATVGFIKEACEYAKGSGVTVCTENILTAEENLRIINLVGENRCKIYFDTQNPHSFHGYNAADMIRKLGNLIVESHVKDGPKGHMSAALLGQGESSFEESIKAFADIQYNGWFVTENMYFREPLSRQSGDPFDLLVKDIAYLKATVKKYFGK